MVINQHFKGRISKEGTVIRVLEGEKTVRLVDRQSEARVFVC